MYTKQFKKTPYPTSINHDIPNITGNLSKKTKSFQNDYKAKTDMSTCGVQALQNNFPETNRNKLCDDLAKSPALNLKTNKSTAKQSGQ